MVCHSSFTNLGGCQLLTPKGNPSSSKRTKEKKVTPDPVINVKEEDQETGDEDGVFFSFRRRKDGDDGDGQNAPGMRGVERGDYARIGYVLVR